MGKSRAELQRDYRERKKKQDPNYLEKERKRAAANRVPAALLSKKKIKKRREKNKQYCAKYRKSKTDEKEKTRNPSDETVVSNNDLQSDEVSSTSQPIPSTSQFSTRASDNRILVKFDFGQKSVPTKKRSRALRKARYQTAKLSVNLQNQIRLTKRWQKRFERLKKQQKPLDIHTESSSTPDKSHFTPRSKTKFDLRSAGVSPRKLPKSVVKRLEMGNCLLQELKASRHGSRQEYDKRYVDKIICGDITRKYRCGRFLNKEVSLNRHRFRKPNTAIGITRRRRNQHMYTALKAEVETYFERDDISRCMPGKNDAVKVGSEKKQVRVLNDYLKNLHDKFLMENPEKKISFSAFCKLRPKNIKITSLLSRNTCLCTIHQNMALKLKCLKVSGVDISANPEVVKRTVTLDDLKQKLNALENTQKEFEHWKRIEVDGKKKMRIVKTVLPHVEFVELMLKEYESFLKHTDRISAQYSAIYHLKETLQVGHVIVQMDFAENFQCQTMDEIQSAYWNATSVTLHPVVAYYRLSENEDLEHKNFVFVSDLNHHNSTAVLTILHKLLPILKVQIPGINTIHYWTDSPSSQYRNRYIINVIANHKQIFDVNACWNYFESGHGKGPCDGIGGTCKRRASEAVKQGKATIQDAHEFYNWAHGDEKRIAYYFYSQQEYDSTAEYINSKTKAIPGTMGLHAVVAKGDGKVMVRSTSCYCQGCVSGNAMCDGWILHDLTSTNDKPNQYEGDRDNNDSGQTTCGDIQNGEDVRFDIGDYVCAVYQKQWYIGEVVNIDSPEKEAEISFLEKKRQLLQWPSREDIVWINFQDIICQVMKPVPTGKCQRMFKLVPGDKEKIERAFNAWNSNA